MSYTPKSTLYNWFKTNKKPTQEQFWAWMDSYWHKSELIPLNQIEDIDVALEQTVSVDTFNSHLSDENAHSLYLAKVDASNLSDRNKIAWKDALQVGTLPPNIGTIDEENVIGNVFTKYQSDNRYLAIQNYTDDIGKVLTDQIGIFGALTFEENSDSSPKQITFSNGKYHGTDAIGQKKTFLFEGDVVETQTKIRNPTVSTDSMTIFYTGENGIEQRGVADLTPFKNAVVNAANAGYKGDLNKADIIPTVVGMYRLLELGDYVNLTPAVDEWGSSAVIKAVPSKINQVYFDGALWMYKGIDLPQASQNIPAFEDVYFPATAGVKAVYHDTFWEVKEGKIAGIIDLPSYDILSKWKPLGLTLNSTFRNSNNPILEVGGIALNTGNIDSSVTVRGRTVSFFDIGFASELELIGDLFFQAIFYYTDTNVFISRQDISSKIFIPTIPGTAKKFKISVFHSNASQTVTQSELNTLIVNCYSDDSITMKNVVDNSIAAAKVMNEYNRFDINLGEGIVKELGRIAVNNGQNSNSNTGIRTAFISVLPGDHIITLPVGYKTSRVVNYKDGKFVENNISLIGSKFIINTTEVVNEVRIVFEKITDGTLIITQSEVEVFKFSLNNLEYNKFLLIANEINKPKVLPDTIYTRNEQLTILNTKDTDINFDLRNRKLIILGGALKDMGNTIIGRITLPISSTGIDLPFNITAGIVLLNRSNNSIVIQTQTAAPLINHYVLFTYQYSGSFESFFVNGLTNYSVNGTPINQKDTRQTNKFAVDNFAIPYWHAPVQPALDTSTINSTTLYDLYENIAALFSSNVTKTIVGQTESPTPYDVIRYDISFNRKTIATQRRRKPRIFVCGGTHGGEKLGVYTTYLFFKFLLTNPNNDEILNALRNNYDWTFIPLVNPYSLNVGVVNGVKSVRWNHNGVDINRNFDYRWADYVDGGVGSQSYKGIGPFSEKESQFVRDTFNSIKQDTVLYLDCHNFGSAGMLEPRSVWFASTFNTFQNSLYAICDRLDSEFKKRYDYIPKDTLVAFSDMDGSSPMSQSWVSNQQVIGATIETDQSDYFNNPDQSFNFNSNVMTRSLEAYVNVFYSLGKYAVDIYNNR